MRPLLYIFDISAIVFRYHFACKNYTDDHGNPNGGVYGVFYTLMHILKDGDGVNVIWTFDGAKNNFRKSLLPTYKSHRSMVDFSIISQLMKVMKYGEDLKIPCLRHDEYEADDIIASICHKLKEHYDICIICNDKDLFQLVEDNKIYIWNFAKKFKMKERDVEEVLGVTPGQVVDFLCLLGDPSDGISGIKKIGKVTARNLIKQYGDMQNIVQSVGYKYDFSSLELNRQLVNLVRDIDINPYPGKISLDILKQFTRTYEHNIFTKFS